MRGISTPAVRSAYLICRKSGAFTRLSTAEFTIGRAAGNSLVIDNPRVSGFHARISFDSSGGGFLLADAGSLNHTCINGQPPLAPNRPAPLPNGARLTLADEQFEFLWD